MQHFDVLDQTGIDEVPCGIREAARIELVRQRHTVHEDRNAVAADAADIDALGTETRPGGFVIRSSLCATTTICSIASALPTSADLDGPGITSAASRAAATTETVYRCIWTPAVRVEEMRKLSSSVPGHP